MKVELNPDFSSGPNGNNTFSFENTDSLWTDLASSSGLSRYALNPLLAGGGSSVPCAHLTLIFDVQRGSVQRGRGRK